MNDLYRVSRLLMRYIASTIFFGLALSSMGFGQNAGNPESDDLPIARVRSINSKRAYIISSGQRANGEKHRGQARLYDENGRLVQESIFQNIEERTTYTWAGDARKANVSYFDLAGNPVVGSNEKFMNTATDPIEKDLCPDFTIRVQENRAQRVAYEYEVCADSTPRATFTFEFTLESRLARWLRVDAKSRTWDLTNTYDAKGILIETKFSVDDRTEAKFHQRAEFVSYEYDAHQNWIRRICSNFDSRAPGMLVHQYVEERKITYYDKKSP